MNDINNLILDKNIKISFPLLIKLNPLHSKVTASVTMLTSLFMND